MEHQLRWPQIWVQLYVWLLIYNQLERKNTYAKEAWKMQLWETTIYWGLGVYSHLFELRSWKLPLGGGDRGISETSTVWHFNSSSRTESIWTYHKPIKSTWHQSPKGRRKKIPTNSCLSEGCDFLQRGMFKHALHVLKCCPPFLLGWRSNVSRYRMGKTS